MINSYEDMILKINRIWLFFRCWKGIVCIYLDGRRDVMKENI